MPGPTRAYEQCDKLVTLQWQYVISLQTLCWEISDESRSSNNKRFIKPVIDLLGFPQFAKFSEHCWCQSNSSLGKLWIHVKKYAFIICAKISIVRQTVMIRDNSTLIRFLWLEAIWSRDARHRVTAATPHRTLPVVSDFNLLATTISSYRDEPRHRRSTLGRRAFSVAGPMAWNVLPGDLRDPSLSADNFRKMLKTHLFQNALRHLAH